MAAPLGVDAKEVAAGDDVVELEPVAPSMALAAAEATALKEENPCCWTAKAPEEGDANAEGEKLEVAVDADVGEGLNPFRGHNRATCAGKRAMCHIVTSSIKPLNGLPPFPR